MEKDKFEILLEEMRSNFRMAFEGLTGVNQRLDRFDARQDRMESRLDRIEARMDRQESRMERLEDAVLELAGDTRVLKQDVSEIKCILVPIPGTLAAHGLRLTALEGTH